LENNEHRQGNFTLALIEGLSGKAKRDTDGAVYLHNLDAYVTDRVKELTKGRQHPVTAKPASLRPFPITKPDNNSTAIVHDVYFSLKDNSPANTARLIEACKIHLTNHPGTLFFAVGTMANGFNGPLNDRDY